MSTLGQNRDTHASYDSELFPLLDMHGAHLEFIDETEVRRLRKLGVIDAFGTRKKTHGYRLSVPTSKVDGYDHTAPSYVPANYAGTRFCFKDPVNLKEGKTITYRFKALAVSESPEHALLRILTPFALEADSYIPRHLCSDEQRASDPGVERRRNTRDIFSISLGSKRSHAPAVVDTQPKRMPLRPPTLTVSAVMV